MASSPSSVKPPRVMLWPRSAEFWSATFSPVVVADLVQLDEQELQQVGRFFRTDQAGRLVALIERLEVLAQVGLRVAATDLLDLRADVTQEVALDGFPQVPGRVLGNPLAGLGDVEISSCPARLRSSPSPPSRGPARHNGAPAG